MKRIMFVLSLSNLMVIAAADNGQWLLCRKRDTIEYHNKLTLAAADQDQGEKEGNMADNDESCLPKDPVDYLCLCFAADLGISLLRLVV